MRKNCRLLLSTLFLLFSITLFAQVREMAEVMPQFQGGEKGLKVWLSQNMKYPQESIENKEEGKVVISCIINEEGWVNEPRIIRHVCDNLDAEAMRLVTNMPKWKPASQDGKPCAVRYVLPIVFSIAAETARTTQERRAFESGGHHKSSERETLKDETTIVVNSNNGELSDISTEFIQSIKQYENFARFSEGMAAVQKKGKWGFINVKGEEVIPCKYDEGARIFSEGLAAVMHGDKYGYINTKGEEVISNKYDWAFPFCEGFAKVILNGKCGFINTKGTLVVPCKYDRAGAFSEGLAAVFRDGNWGYINKQGMEVIPCKLNAANKFHDGCAYVQDSEGFWCYINTKGSKVPKRNFFYDGLAKIERNGEYGFINTKGEVAIPCKYDDAQDFSNGMAAVMRGGKYGYINTKGEEVIPCKFDKVYGFFEGRAAIMIGEYPDKKWGFIDKNGVVAFISDDAELIDLFYEGIWD